MLLHEDTDEFGMPKQEEKSVDWEWEFERHGQKFMGHFHVHSKGSAGSSRAPSRDSLDPYGGEGELPELELVGIFDEDGKPITLSKDEIATIENDAAEKYHEERNESAPVASVQSESVTTFGIPLTERIKGK